eukprot:5012224-Amphidinium_carterae.5
MKSCFKLEHRKLDELKLLRLYILGFHVEKGGGEGACQRAQTRFQGFVQKLRSSYEPIRINALLFDDDSKMLREAMKEFEQKALTSTAMFEGSKMWWLQNTNCLSSLTP